MMGSIPSTVHYCSVSRANRVLYAYSTGNHEIDNLAALCLENVPPFHKWYTETFACKTFGFLVEDGYTYFTIVDDGLRSPGLLTFLGHVRDEFRKVTRKGSRGSFSSSSSNSAFLQEQLLPIVRRLIASLERVVSQGGNDWSVEITSADDAGLSPSPSNADGQNELVSSTIAPLLGKSSFHEKKKAKDHILMMRDIELEEHRNSSDRGGRSDPAPSGAASLGRSGSAVLIQKDYGSMRNRSAPQNVRKKWWRLVRIVLAIDASVCVVLFLIWLLVCFRTRCMR
ncbi:hypothetical protein MLD38_033635 [Melastoma candidum]|uniref:Uncharacterized protein n=1 Tax=Melastoma candidum TaxID=119954 RepID=A0ACB9MA15_9MYRT|nr:hypothetical protein MLD38_033635 [Melastoma candidum]